MYTKRSAVAGWRARPGLGPGDGDRLRAKPPGPGFSSYTHLRAHETVLDLVCRLLLEKKKKKKCRLLLDKTQYKQYHNQQNKQLGTFQMLTRSAMVTTRKRPQGAIEQVTRLITMIKANATQPSRNNRTNHGILESRPHICCNVTKWSYVKREVGSARPCC